MIRFRPNPLRCFIVCMTVWWCTAGGWGRAETIPDRGDSVIHGRPTFRTYPDRGNQLQHSIRAVTVDRRGYVWVGTLDGLACFNGYEWRGVDLPGPRRSVGALAASSDGGLWVGTDDQVLRYETGRWTLWMQTEHKSLSEAVTCLAEGKTASGAPLLWIGTTEGLVGVETTGTPQTARRYHPDPPFADPTVRCILTTVTASGDPVLWVGGVLGLARFEKGRWTAFSAANSPLPDAEVTCLFESSDSAGGRRLWIGTDGGGPVCFDTSGDVAGGRWYVLNQKNSPLANRSVWSIALTVSGEGRGVLWIGTSNGGLIRCMLGARPDDVQRWDVFNRETSDLPSNVVQRLFVPDPRHGRILWIGTENGLVSYAEGRWETLDTVASMPRGMSVYSLLETADANGNKAVWIGTRDQGVARATVVPATGRSDWTVFDRDNTGYFRDRVSSLIEAHPGGGPAVVWAGTYGDGVVAFDRGRWTPVLGTGSGSSRLRVRCLLETRSAQGKPVQWVGTAGSGLGRLADGTWTFMTTANSGLPSNVVWTLAETTDANGGRVLWVGTTGGLSRLDLETGRWTTYTERNSRLPDSRIFSLSEARAPDGSRRLWVGTSTGGAVAVPLDDDAAEWILFSETVGPRLPMGTVYRILHGADSVTYLLTGKGVVRLRPRVARPLTAGDFEARTYTIEDGLPSNEGNIGAGMVDRWGRIWVGTVAGIGIFDPRSQPVDGGLKPLYIERAVCGIDRRPFSDGAEVPHHRGNVEFNYALLDYLNAQAVRYQVRLIGQDESPSDWTREAHKEYTNLTPGPYTFQVWARDLDGTVTGPVTLGFTVTPPWWQTWWAYAMYAMTALVVFLGGSQIRVLALRRLNQSLEAKVVARTAELTQTVERLREAQLEMARKNEQLRQAQKMEIVGRLTSGIAHNFNNLLTVVTGHAGMLAMQVPADTPTRKGIEAIREAARRGRDLVLQLMAFSRRTELAAGRTDPNEIVVATVGMAGQLIGEKITLETALAPDLFPVWMNPRQLEQVLLNLIVNARDAMPDGGAIQVRTAGAGFENAMRPVDRPRIRYTGQGKVLPDKDGLLEPIPADAYIAISVEDTGAGMDVTIREHLFEPFFTTKDPGRGTGLGLATVLGTVTQAGGFIEVESAPGRGSTFHLYLPRYVPEKSPVAREPVPVAVSSGEK